MEPPVIMNNSGSYGGSPDCEAPEASRYVWSSNGMSVVPCKDPCSLLHLPEPPMLKVLGYLSFRDILATAKTCTYLNQVITDDNLLARSWFATLAAHQQNQFKEIARDISDRDLQHWLGQFTSDATAAGKLCSQYPGEQTTDGGLKTGEAQKGKYFPQTLFYRVSQLMAGCQQFEPVLEKHVESDYVKDVSFSTHGDHLVIFRSNTATILGFTGNGQWNEQAGFSYDPWSNPEEPTSVNNSFITRGRHVLTWDEDRTAKIFAYNPDHSCTEQFTIVHEGEIISADLSCDGHQVVITCDDGSAKIHSCNDAGHWSLTADIGDDRIWKACFSPDGSRVLTRPWNPWTPDPCAKMHSRNEEGGWTSETIGEPNANFVRFSPNGNPLLMFGFRQMAKILRLNKKDGNTMESIKHDNNDYKIVHATASPDGRHVITVNLYGKTGSTTLKIFSRDDNGNWTGKTDNIPIFNNNAHPDLTPKFSSDGCHVMAAKDLNTLEILSCEKHCDWMQTSIPLREKMRKTFFSPDSRHAVAITCDNYGASCYIFGYIEAQGWIETIIRHYFGGPQQLEASISADSRHIVSFCCFARAFEYHAKIYGHDGKGKWRQKTIITHAGPIYTARFNADSTHLVTASKDGTSIILGRYAGGRWVNKTILKHAHPVRSAIFSVDSRQVVTVSGSHDVKIWRLVAAEMVLDSLPGTPQAATGQGVVLQAGNQKPEANREN